MPDDLWQVLGKPELVDLLKKKAELLLNEKNESSQTKEKELTKKEIEAVLAALTSTVHDEVLTKGNEIRLRDLGTFKQKVSDMYV